MPPRHTLQAAQHAAAAAALEYATQLSAQNISSTITLGGDARGDPVTVELRLSHYQPAPAPRLANPAWPVSG